MRRRIGNGQSQPGKTRGERLRRDEPPAEADRQIYSDYRDTFAEPLREVAETIGSFADGAPVQSRLKRFETTVEKLRRSTSDLSRLEDIAGCRVVLPTMVEQRQVLYRIRGAWEVMRERDYQTTPRDGYRALHIVVSVQGRPVEVQVRTLWEDMWANASEALANNLDPEIKYGGGRLRRARCWMMHPCFARDWTLPQHVALSLTALMIQTRQTLEVR